MANNVIEFKRKNPWYEYERRKAEISRKGLTPEQFLAAMKQIAKELRL